MDASAAVGAGGLSAFSFEDILARTVWLVDAGGPVVAVLIAVSVVALAIVLVKLYQFRSLRIGDRRFIGPALDAHRRGVEETLRKMLEQKLREQGAAPAAPAGR